METATGQRCAKCYLAPAHCSSTKRDVLSNQHCRARVRTYPRPRKEETLAILASATCEGGEGKRGERRKGSARRKS
eukprot:2124908-Rhodomonas_salina.1